MGRRTALKALGVGLVGAAVPSTTAADAGGGEGRSRRDDRQDGPRGSVPLELMNPRARHAAHAWERGYRGRADRTVAVVDTGVDARHGDLGPWTGVWVSNDDGDSELRLERAPDGVESVDDAPVPDRNGVPALVAWHEDLPEGEEPEGEEGYPRDDPGLAHGTGVCSVAAGTGRARVFDPDAFLERWTFGGGEGEGDAPRTLEGGEVVEREFVVPADGEGSELLCAVAGRWLDVALLGPDGEELATGQAVAPLYQEGAGSSLPDGPFEFDSGEGGRAVLSADAVHDSGDGPGERTYALRVEPTAPGDALGEAVVRTAAATAVVERGTDLDAEGSMGPPPEAEGSAVGSFDAAFGRALHPGVAPGCSLAATAGTPGYPLWDLDLLARSVETYVSTFKVRALNMSWGDPAGTPTGAVQNQVDRVHEGVATVARAGVLPVHAVMNYPGTPAGGNDTGSAAPESVSTVNANHLYGINHSSSGGLATVTDDGDVYRTPDVCALGTRETAAGSPDPEDADGVGGTVEGLLASPEGEYGEYGSVSTYRRATGTSFAAPSVTGLAALVTQAMEEDGPEGLAFPAPSELFADRYDETDRLGWVLKAKSAILATASTTAFNALPWHGDQAPAYTPGARDPYEGFGHVNAGAAVDAVSRDLTAETDGGRAVLGLDVPDDEQAAAGYLAGEGEYRVDVAFEGYEGADADLTNGTPHVDLHVYDALSPEGVDDDGPATGTPTVVERDLGAGGTGGPVTVDLDADDVYLVVAELVRVPGDGTDRLPEAVVEGLPEEAGGLVFNGADVRANLELGVDRTDH